MIARVLPDLPAVDRPFDYLVPESLRDQVRVGTVVRVDLHGRRVRGWVVELPDEPAAGVDLKAIGRVSSQGPPPEVVELARWAAWRWAGRWVHLLRTASPPVAVHGWSGPVPVAPRSGDGVVARPVVRRLPPAADRLPVVLDAVAAGPCIVVAPAVDAALRLGDRLRREGSRVAILAGEVRAGEWDAARRPGVTVVGTRAAVWAPIADAALAGIVVLDEHDESLQSEQAPTWHARDVAIERARRAGVPCTLVSATPTLHALAVAELVVPDVSVERAGWPIVEVVDRRDEDPVKGGLFSPRLAALVRGGGRIVCVLNRLGRSRLLACVACGATASCAACGAAVAQPVAGVLRCGACATERPPVCLDCGGGRFKNLRMGVARAREELEALAGEPVAEVTASGGDPAKARVVVGTEAVLHRLRARSADVVAFLDLDQELLAARYRAGELTLALLGRAARALGPRHGGGRLLLQTRLPEHPAVRAAVLGDPGAFDDEETKRRAVLGYPPSGALAVVSGVAAAAWAAAASGAGLPPGVELLGPADGRWLLRAPTSSALADAIAAVPRHAGKLRIEVDPPRA